MKFWLQLGMQFLLSGARKFSESKMRFLLDENMPFSAMRVIKLRGCEVEHVKLSSLKSCDDKEIAKYAKEKNAVLISKDIEFGSLILYPENCHYGLIILRVPYHFTGEQITNVLKEFFDSYNIEDLAGKKIILELGRYRVRKPLTLKSCSS